jgi:hypothetical protein
MDSKMLSLSINTAPLGPRQERRTKVFLPQRQHHRTMSARECANQRLYSHLEGLSPPLEILPQRHYN